MSDSLFYRFELAAGAYGRATYDLSSEVESFTWEQDDTKPDRLTLVVPDNHKVLSHVLVEGMRIDFAFGTENNHATVFRGRIYGVDVVTRSGEPQTLTIRAEDRLAELGLKHTRLRRWAEQPLSALVTQLLQPYSFSEAPSIDAGGDPLVEETQFDENDLIFLSRLCEYFGCVAYIEQLPHREVFRFVGRSILAARSPELYLSHGRTGASNSLTEFNGTCDVRRASVGYVLGGVDRKTREQLEPLRVRPEWRGATDDPFLEENLAAIVDQGKRAQLRAMIAATPIAGGELVMLREGDLSEQLDPYITKATTAAELALRRDNWRSVNALGMSASGSCAGIPTLRARTTINIDDVGGRLSGHWYVAEVKHTVDRNGYLTDFSCKR